MALAAPGGWSLSVSTPDVRRSRSVSAFKHFRHSRLDGCFSWVRTALQRKYWTCNTASAGVSSRGSRCAVRLQGSLRHSESGCAGSRVYCWRGRTEMSSGGDVREGTARPELLPLGVVPTEEHGQEDADFSSIPAKVSCR